jgi:hypothetical protein
MRSNAFSSAVALALAIPALTPAPSAAASLRDFRLPAERPQPQQPPPDLQGPVAPDVPESRRQPAEPTPSPTANPGEPPASERPAPTIVIPSALEAPPAATASPRPGAAPPDSAVAAAPSAAPSAVSPTSVPPAVAAPSEASSPPGVRLEPGAGAAPQARWPWWLGAVAFLLAGLGAAGWALRRRARRAAGPAIVPQIERHRPATAPASPPSRPPQSAEPLQVALEPLRLALTLVNATLAYRLELTNRGTAPLTGVAIGADMISAHASLSREEQLSGPRAGNGSGQPLQRIERIDPGQRQVIEGEFRLPFPQIVPIRQGNAALLLPLARFRVEADGAAPVVRTFVVGQPGRDHGLRPFRLDEGPRIYPHLAHHAFA